MLLPNAKNEQKRIFDCVLLNSGGSKQKKEIMKTEHFKKHQEVAILYSSTSAIFSVISLTTKNVFFTHENKKFIENIVLEISHNVGKK